MVFGTYSLSVDRVHAAEVGLDTNDFIAVKRYLTFFHILFIPLFPIGNHWAVIDRFNQKFEPNEFLAEELYKKKGNYKTPFYAYLGLLLMLALGVAFAIVITQH